MTGNVDFNARINYWIKSREVSPVKIISLLLSETNHKTKMEIAVNLSESVEELSVLLGLSYRTTLRRMRDYGYKKGHFREKRNGCVIV